MSCIFKRNSHKIWRLEVVSQPSLFNGKYEVDPVGASLALSLLTQKRESPKTILFIIRSNSLSLSQAYNIALQIKLCKLLGYTIFGIATTLDLPILLALAYCNYRFAPPLAGPIEFYTKIRHIHIGGVLDELGVLGFTVQTGNLKSSASALQENLPDCIQNNEKEVTDQLYKRVINTLQDAIGNNLEKKLNGLNHYITSGIEANNIGLLTGVAYPEFIHNILIKEMNLLNQDELRFIPCPKQHRLISFFPERYFKIMEIDDWVINNPNHFTKAIIKLSLEKSLLGVFFIINCHGGNLNLADKIWLLIRDISKKIPSVAYIEQATSAGYYIASAANKICINPCGYTGSIGTMLVRLDFSRLLKRLGISFSVVRSGQGPAINPSTNPPSQEELEIIERRAQIAKVLFLERVKASRNLDDKILAEISDGRLLSCENALSHGLIDKACGLVESLEVLISISKSNKQFGLKRTRKYNFIKSWFMQFLES